MGRMKEESYAYERMRMIIPYGHTHTICEDPSNVSNAMTVCIRGPHAAVHIVQPTHVMCERPARWRMA